MSRVLSGIGGWAGIGLAAGLTADTAAAWQNFAGRAATGRDARRPRERDLNSAGLGAVGGYASLSEYTDARRPADGLRAARLTRV